MDGGYSMFHSIENPEKYLVFNRNGKPINYATHKLDKQCRKIFKRVTEDSSNGLSTSTVDYEPTSLANNNNNNFNTNNNYSNNNNNINNLNHPNPHRHHHKSSSTRANHRTHSNKIETSKLRSTFSQQASSTSKRINNHSNTSNTNSSKTQPHHVRHHHNELPLRHYHTISNNKNIDSNDNMSSTKQLGNENLNAIYNQDASGDVNKNNMSNDNSNNNNSDNIKVNVNENKGRQNVHNRQLRKPTQASSKLSKVEINLDQKSSYNYLGKDETNNNNDTNSNNCTYSTKVGVDDEMDDKNLKGRKIVKGRNTAQANKCNNSNNNRRHRKNNENGRNSRKPSQKSSSHKNQQANP